MQKLVSLKNTALLGIAACAAQLLASFFGGSLCKTDGCEIVEAMTRFPAWYLSIVGILFFFVLRTLSTMSELAESSSKRETYTGLLGLLLYAGAAVEGVLVGTQVFVAETLCVYCIGICAVIFVNIGVFTRQYKQAHSLRISGAVFVATLLVTGSINFSASPVDFEKDLVAGAVATSGTSTAKAFLLYSESCKHCVEVIAKLQFSPELRDGVSLNPIFELEKTLPANFQPSVKYQSTKNLRVFQRLGLTQTPALVVIQKSRLEVVVGSTAILARLQSLASKPATLPVVVSKNGSCEEASFSAGIKKSCDE